MIQSLETIQYRVNSHEQQIEIIMEKLQAFKEAMTIISNHIFLLNKQHNEALSLIEKNQKRIEELEQKNIDREKIEYANKTSWERIKAILTNKYLGIAVLILFLLLKVEHVEAILHALGK